MSGSEVVLVALVAVVADGIVQRRWPSAGEAVAVVLTGLFAAHLLWVMWA